MRMLLTMGLLSSGCGAYFMPEMGDWSTETVEITSIQCVEDGFEGKPFEQQALHLISKHPHPLRFQFDIDDFAWVGGDISTECLLKDRDFECEHQYVEWLGRLDETDTTPMPDNDCLNHLLDPTQEICWGRGFSMSGSFTKDEDAVLTANYQYSLVCLTGAACQMTAGTERCTADITATYRANTP